MKVTKQDIMRVAKMYFKPETEPFLSSIRRSGATDGGTDALT